MVHNLNHFTPTTVTLTILDKLCDDFLHLQTFPIHGGGARSCAAVGNGYTVL